MLSQFGFFVFFPLTFPSTCAIKFGEEIPPRSTSIPVRNTTKVQLRTYSTYSKAKSNTVRDNHQFKLCKSDGRA
ncbi:hypothetical protein F4782DRAFT_481233 [Xylaria castorea]|nr:hypothetical protein F4782DRAFT_481233 [Xylaria castorea]